MTTSPNGLLALIHDRMPTLLRDDKALLFDVDLGDSKLALRFPRPLFWLSSSNYQQ